MPLEDDEALTERCGARVGKTLRGKWHLDKLLGVGGMAAVYAASHRNGARAAIKLLHPEMAMKTEARDRFAREAYIANTVGHQGSVAVLDDDVDEDGAPYLVMELLEGESVADRADKNGGKLPFSEVLWIASQTLAVLQQAHEKGIVHRDIKPENLFITNDGKLKVLDFGIARLDEAAGAARKRTRTGFLLGTPGYMAPEQAAGRPNEVDGRTDLWAVGATMFNLLSGFSVHEGETYSLQLIHAATRPARSLARVWPEAPLPLVQVVDRALAFDQGKRYPDARAMQEEVQRIAAAGPSLTRDAPLRFSKPASSRSAPLPREEPESGVVPPPPESEQRIDRVSIPAVPRERISQQNIDTIAAGPEHELERGESGSLSHVTASPEEVAAMRELFTLVDKAIQARTQYGASHKEATRRFEAAYRQAITAVDVGDGQLSWTVSPYAFLAEKEVLWEPKPPLDGIPYRLFADGVRVFHFVRGLEARELEALLQIWMRDPGRDIAPEDDLVTLLWDAGFAHVMHEQYDSFAEGDQDERAKFEGERQEVFALAGFDTSFQLEDCWQARSKPDPGKSIAAKHRAVLGALESEAAARAAALQLPGARESAQPATLTIDPASRTALAARLDVDLATTGERFVLAAASAYVHALKDDSMVTLTNPLRTAVTGLSTSSVPDAIRFICALCSAVERVAPTAEREAASGRLAGALVSPETLKLLLAGAVSQSSGDLTSILRFLDASHISGVLAALPHIHDAALMPMLLAYVERCGVGHEAEIGAIIPTSDMELALAVLRLLISMGTPAAKEAAAKAVQSPHPVVRIEALGHVEGLASNRLRLELRRLLEDPEPGVRLATLRAIATHAVRAAGPSLALRIRSAEFDGLPYEERSQALETLCTLLPARAESVSVELLSDHRLVPTEAHEQTRALAAELLAREATSPEARDALEAATKGRWRNSERVRTAASRALVSFNTRSSRPPPLQSQPVPASSASVKAPPSRKSSS
jgi:eukaryotic-like serine/threonine-protein kinase